MRIGVNNYFGYFKIVGKTKVQQSGSDESAVIVFDGMIEKTLKRGTITSTKKIHVPIMARGRLALAMDSKIKIDDFIWVIGEMDNFTEFDLNGVQQLRVVIKVAHFSRNNNFDMNFEDLFKSEV